MARKMKTRTVALCLLALLVAGCQEGNLKLNTYMLSGHDAEGEVMILTPLDDQGLAAGAGIKYYKLNRSGALTPDVVTVDIIRDITIEGRLVDMPGASPFGPLLEGLAATPFIGAQLAIPVKGSNTDIRWNVLAGLKFTNDEKGRWHLVLLGGYGDGNLRREDESGGPTADDVYGGVGLNLNFYP